MVPETSGANYFATNFELQKYLQLWKYFVMGILMRFVTESIAANAFPVYLYQAMQPPRTF